MEKQKVDLLINLLVNKEIIKQSEAKTIMRRRNKNGT